MFNLLKSIKNGSDAAVLMYHRITDSSVDPWQLAVSPQNFDGQLKVLNKNYRVIAVEELLHQLKLNKVKSKTVCLTFDDGYLDNYLNAKPLLEKYNCPATFFIPPYYIKMRKAFWWDELLTLILFSPKLPEYIYIRKGELSYKRQVTEKANMTSPKDNLDSWVWDQPYPTERCEIYMELWAILQPLPIDEIENCLAQLHASIAEPATVPLNDRAMSVAQLNDLTNNASFKAGIHTMTHPALAHHKKAEQEKELLTCKAELQDQLNQSTSVAAYPYGNFNEVTLQIMNENHLTAGFTTKAQLVNSKSDLFKLGRFHVTNQNQYDFEQQMKQWFSKR